MAGKFEIFKDKKGGFRFRLKSGNGEIVLSSEGYKDRSGAVSGAQAVKRNAGLLARFEKRAPSGGKFHFVLKAANHKVIGTSETYPNEAACDAGIKSVIQVAPLAAIEDKSA